MAARYVAAFDDSGGNEKLVDWYGNPSKGDQPITAVTSCFVREDLLADFNSDWRELQSEIQHELGLQSPPPLHMRLMWGRESLERPYRGESNPYRRASFDQIQDWVFKALQIVQQYTRHKYGLGSYTVHQTRERAAAIQQRYFLTQEAQAELSIIRKKSRKLYKRYHHAITSPVLGELAKALLYVHEHLEAVRASAVACLVDRFEIAKGIDEAEVVQAAKDVCGLHLVSEIARVDVDSEPLTQAADVIGFASFREIAAKYGFIDHDAPLSNIVAANQQAPFCSADVHHRVNRKHHQFLANALTIHFAVARRRIVDHDDELAEALVSVEEFHWRARHAQEQNHAGVSVFRDPVQRPTMPKTPH